mmetsp:Transcript_38120/g.93663  ORF Transcript_38120/g.93663 Transcript_38120/m.93663 type:complete len:228 (-) Transcript_38120:352-1035(-)
MMSFSDSLSPVRGCSMSFLMISARSAAMTCPVVRRTAQGTELDRFFFEMGHMKRSCDLVPPVSLEGSTGVNLTGMRSLSLSGFPVKGQRTLSSGFSLSSVGFASGVRSGIQKHESLAERFRLTPSSSDLCPSALPAALCDLPMSFSRIVSKRAACAFSSLFPFFIGRIPHSLSSNWLTASSMSLCFRLLLSASFLARPPWNLAVSSAMRCFSFRMYCKTASRSYRMP